MADWEDVLSRMTGLLRDGLRRKATEADAQDAVRVLLSGVPTLALTNDCKTQAAVERLATQAREQLDSLGAVLLHSAGTGHNLEQFGEFVFMAASMHIICVRLLLRCSLDGSALCTQLANCAFGFALTIGTELLQRLQRPANAAQVRHLMELAKCQLIGFQLSAVDALMGQLLQHRCQALNGGRDMAALESMNTAVFTTAAAPTIMVPWLGVTAEAISRLLISVRVPGCGMEPQAAAAYFVSWELVALPGKLHYYKLINHEKALYDPSQAETQRQLAALAMLTLEASLTERGGLLQLHQEASTAGEPSTTDVKPCLEDVWSGLRDAFYCLARLVPLPSMAARLQDQRYCSRLLGNVRQALRVQTAFHHSDSTSKRLRGVAMALEVHAYALTQHVTRIAGSNMGADALVEAAVRAAHSVITMLPEAAAVVQALVGETESSGDGQDLEDVLPVFDRLSINYSIALSHGATARVTCERVAAWCAAVDASLRLLPLLVRTVERQRDSADFQSTAGAHESSEPAVDMIMAAIRLWLEYFNPVSAFLYRATKPGPDRKQTVAELPVPLWQLHTTACRFVQWACAGDGGSPEPLVLSSLNWRVVASAVHTTFKEAFELHRLAGSMAEGAGKSEEAAALKRRMQGMAAAHALALPLVSAKAGNRMHCVQDGCRRELLYIAAACPDPAALLDPELLAALESCTRQQWQEETDLDALAMNVHEAIWDAEDWPRFACLLLNRGVVADGLAAVERASVAARDTPLPSIFRGLLVSVYTICRNLTIAAPDEIERLGQQISSAADADATEQLQEHKRLLHVRLLQLRAAVDIPNAMQPPASLDCLRVYRSKVLPPAQRLAGALDACWQLCSQKAQLEAAQVAAARSCAYPGCANLGGQGGPRVGEGKGSMRCSKCKAAWYCGTACSHRDWAQGHKLVCRALGTARQQERAAAAAQAP